MSSFLRWIWGKKDGQSLVEILVGLAIGALLIGTATIGVVFVLKSSTTNQNLGAGNDLTQGLLDNAQSFAAANWSGIYGLAHGASSTYFIVASGTSLVATPGEEGVLGSDVTSGLIGHWGFDEGTGTIAYDTSGDGYNGAWSAAGSYATGTIGAYAGNFTSSPYVNVGSAAVFKPAPSSTFSVSLWVAPSSSCLSPVQGCGAMGNSSYLVGGYQLGWYNTNTFYFDVENASGICTGGITVPTTQYFSAGQWVYVVAEYDGINGKTYIYLNGSLVKQGNCANIGTAPNNLYIGKSPQGGWVSPQYVGLIDDVRIYNRVLSSSEIDQLYKSQDFSRYFYVQDVCRTNDASSSIVGNAPCSGGNWDDPLTQQVTAVTQWLAGASTDETSLSTYLTNYNNFTLRQSDWSGGGGQTGPLTIPDTQYASGTNVTGTSTLGSFQIQNLTQQ